MAEFVQKNLEEMLEEVEQMARVKLFTGAETRSILKKRKAFEYKLQRQTKEKEDLLQYIQYEINLHALLMKRREDTGYKFKVKEIDFAIVNRVHRLFGIACSRFQEDTKLWLSHVGFAKSRNHKSAVSNIFTRMLQIHTRKPALWIAAAKWEIETNASMENARNLLQRGLRFLPESQKLWIEYFRMELLNVDKLKKRREVLGIALMDVDDSETADVVVDGKIAEVVFQQAVDQVPNVIDFVLAFLPILKDFPFAKSLADHIFDHLKLFHHNSEKTWDALARRHLENHSTGQGQENGSMKVDAEDLCYSVYEEALTVLPTDLMWTFYLTTCLEFLDSSTSESFRKRLQSVCHIFYRAEGAGHLTEEMYEKWLTVLLKTGQTAEIDRVYKEATKRHGKSASLWSQRLSHVMRLGRPEVEDTVKQALVSVPEKESLGVRKLALEYYILQDVQQAESLLEDSVMLAAVIALPMKEFYLDLSSQKDTIKKTRKLYERLSGSQPLSVNFFRKYISIEKAQPKVQMEKIRLCYESALREYESYDTDLWLDFIREELSLPEGEPERAGKLYWRAMKALSQDQTEDFIKKYTLLQSTHTS